MQTWGGDTSQIGFAAMSPPLAGEGQAMPRCRRPLQRRRKARSVPPSKKVISEAVKTLRLSHDVFHCRFRHVPLSWSGRCWEAGILGNLGEHEDYLN
ncbi:hypothetical protein GGTG_09797 [Gaeumannomyces tritici R3-111a-1]|uniref:Uncharacterized protein n=1 Tax=Gaeumannomyces tritici (strain R3-111a-1) TaxID=644352 RepID=J3P8G3_GAET3|nr:hypothetical protein GGTG_09797 [Gaeumannomyces tritici R3-111a-1]EJT72946.1 hypothetical protein GGTG_09797 [Gaeumannomyces tritici R3-111a-1]